MTNNLAPRLHVDVHLAPDFTSTVHLYDHRSPIAEFSPGGFSAGMQIKLTDFGDDSPAEAEAVALAARRFADWAAQYAAGCRVHADRVAAEQDRRDASDDMRADAQAEAHAEAQALGYHDDDCRAEIEHDAMLDEIAGAS